MRDLSKAMEVVSRNNGGWEQQPTLSYMDFLHQFVENPARVARNVYQVYRDMIKTFICEGHDEYAEDPESIEYLNFNCNRLFVENSDRPFFADRLFANRLMKHVDSLGVGAQQNKIYIFEGPHGSGKSTFLNNLLRKYEEYTNTPDGSRYEIVWRLPNSHIATGVHSLTTLSEKLAWFLEQEKKEQEQQKSVAESGETPQPMGYFEVPCPNHDNPILLIPKESRRRFFDDLFENDEFKWKLFTDKQYEWIFQDIPCTICTSLHQALLRKYKDQKKIFDMVYARPYAVNRRLGEGVSVFNPGDRPLSQIVIRNPIIQRSLDALFNDSNQVSYLYSQYAKTNNGIYALMDIKANNTERLMELHNIISDGVHKVEDIEENVNSLFFALMNPEDKKLVKDLQAFSDRVEYINIPYVLDLKTEVEIYRDIFGKHIDQNFLPKVLHNFARVIIATRLRTRSEAMIEWIGESEKYDLYCDQNLQLLKMEIYTGHIPKWLSEEDTKGFTAKRRQKIIAESESDGWKGLSGRDSISMFGEFLSTYSKGNKLIDMSMLGIFFRKFCKQDRNILPMGFLDSLLKMYNYSVLQEVKEALYYYNEEQISRDIQNYMFAVNFEPGTVETCKFTGEQLEINSGFFERMEAKLLTERGGAEAFRKDVQKIYTTITLTQEMMRDGLDITETSLYQNLNAKYVYNLKEKVLDPFLRNENFRMAVKDFREESFKTYDKKIRDDVTYMIKNLREKFNYSNRGAREICIYVIDNVLSLESEPEQATTAPSDTTILDLPLGANY